MVKDSLFQIVVLRAAPQITSVGCAWFSIMLCGVCRKGVLRTLACGMVYADFLCMVFQHAVWCMPI